LVVGGRGLEQAAVEIGEYFMEEEAGKKGAEGTALGEPFLLEK
jgi:hypothetical protein